jgi:hypothetical protein
VLRLVLRLGGLAGGPFGAALRPGGQVNRRGHLGLARAGYPQVITVRLALHGDGFVPSVELRFRRGQRPPVLGALVGSGNA